ncbi:MAG TPA: CoA transferase [Dehalococcoidia bacterium]|nr:CoA transferase [Dehalococcoidia bacterium]
MPGPFEGLRVIEFGRFIAAPYCAQLLADGGADVIKVEPVEGDATRRNGPVIPGEARQYLNKNRGKRSMAVDLSNPEVLAGVRRLVHGADVVITNFRPGQAKRFGLDYESVSAVNPRVVYAENTAFGEDGPMAGAPGMDIIVQAYTGLSQFTANGPIPPVDPLVDYGAALLLAWGISTALYHRERSGRGQKLNVSLLQAALVLQNNHLNHIDVIDGWRHEFVEYLKTAFVEGKSWAEVLAHRQSLLPDAFGRAYYGFFATCDGTIAIAAGGRPNQLRMLKLLDLEDRWVTEPGWLPEDGRAHAERMHERVASKLREQTSEYWLRAFTEAGIPAAPVRMKDEVLEDRQAWENGFYVRLEHELVGGLTVVAPPVVFSETPLAAKDPPPPLGKHTRELLVEAGLDEEAIDRLAAAGAVAVG